jgi:hypothetical protein
MMHRTLAFLLVAAPLAVLPAQESRIAARFPAAEALAITALIDSAAQTGLPREPLILRALEGAAKGIPGSRVRVVLGRYRDAMTRARDVVGQGGDPTELATAAAALLEGVPPAHLAELRQLRGTKSITVPLGAYLDMMARGTSPAIAWDRVNGLARRKAADQEFARLSPGLQPNPRPQ